MNRPSAQTLASHLLEQDAEVLEVPETIYAQLGMSPRTLTYALADLEQRGLITWEKRRPGGVRIDHWTISITDRSRLEAAVASPAEGGVE